MWQSATTANTQLRHRLIERSKVYFPWTLDTAACLFSQFLNHINRCWEVEFRQKKIRGHNLFNMCHYLHICFYLFYTWTYHGKHGNHCMLWFPVINWMYNVSILMWAMKIYCIDFWSHSETIARIEGQMNQGWHQTPLYNSPTLILSTHSHHTTPLSLCDHPQKRLHTMSSSSPVCLVMTL